MSAFVTIADYEVAFNAIVTGNAGLEAKVQWALDGACDEIRGELGDQVLDLVEDDVIVLHGTGHQSLLLPQLPIVAVNSVTIDNGLGSELVVTDYKVDFSGILYRRKGWPWGFGNVTVDYDHGYGAYEGLQLPNDLKTVALQVARSTVSSLPAGITSETIGGYSYTRSLGAAIGADAYEKLLNRYAVKRVPVP